MQIARTIMLAIATMFLGVVAYQQSEIITNQKAQMRQVFHGDGITLWGVLGDGGLSKISDGSGVFTPKESYAAGSLLHRFIIAQNDIGMSYSRTEKEHIFAECRGMMRSPIMQRKWDEVRMWYTDVDKYIIDSCLPKEEK